MTAPADPATERWARLTEALTREHYRRARGRIKASPEDHSAAMAHAVLAALPELAAADQLHTRLTEMVNGWKQIAREQDHWHDHWHREGDEVTARIARVRASMADLFAADLRTLLEET